MNKLDVVAASTALALTLGGCSSLSSYPVAQVLRCPAGYYLARDYMCHSRWVAPPPASYTADDPPPVPDPPAPSWLHDGAVFGAGAGAGVIGSTVAQRMSGAGAAVGDGEAGGAIAGAGEGAGAGGATEGATVGGELLGGAEEVQELGELGVIIEELGGVAVELAPFGISSESTSREPWRNMIRYPVNIAK